MSVESLVRGLRHELAEAGLHGSFLVRDLHSGAELGIDPDLEYPAASLVKVPLAVATLERIADGELDGATRLEVSPGGVTTAGPVGLTKFRHPALISIEDLLYLSTSMSDSTAADALFDLTAPAEVAASLRKLGIDGIAVRHALRELTETPAERLDPDDAHLAHSLAIEARTEGRGHRIAQLDVTRANSGSARAFVDLVHEVWLPTRLSPDVAVRVRELMGENIFRQRLAPDFGTDAARWSSKTGTLLNLRHEVGVVEHSDGPAFAVAALTESRVPAVRQPGSEALMGRVARALRDHLRE